MEIKELMDFAIAELRRRKEAAELEREASLLEEKNDELPKLNAGRGLVTADSSRFFSEQEKIYKSLQDAYAKEGYL